MEVASKTCKIATYWSLKQNYNLAVGSFIILIRLSRLTFILICVGQAKQFIAELVSLSSYKLEGSKML